MFHLEEQHRFVVTGTMSVKHYLRKEGVPLRVMLILELIPGAVDRTLGPLDTLLFKVELTWDLSSQMVQRCFSLL